MAYLVYQLLLLLVAPMGVPWRVLHARLRGARWRDIGESFGFLRSSIRADREGAVWLHAVSVGEVLAIQQLVGSLRDALPDAPLFVSVTTATGRRLAEEKLGGLVDGVFTCPLDLPFAVRSALARVKPRLLVVAETEIWPNLFCLARLAGARVLIVNARISDRSAPRYRRLRWLFGPVLRYVDAILAQSLLDAERLVEAGAPPDRVSVGGNLKHDFPAQAQEPPPAVAALLGRSKASPVVVAGSTREGEEALVLDAFAPLAAAHPRALLVLAPRHPQRFDEAATLLASSGLPWRRRSELGATDEGLALPGVLLLDSLGELASLYAVSDVVFVGGSLNGWGGHNVLEPALAGKPVVVGPDVQNFRAIVDDLLAADGLLQVDGAGALGPALMQLAADAGEARALGERGRRAAERQRGATARATRRAVELHGLAGTS